VLEELHASPDFLSWWLERVGVVGEPLATKFIGAWHSVSHPTLGESDLLLLVGDGNGKRYAVLTENKIDAPPQAQQGERYRQRGTAGVEDGRWHDFRTCIIAPKRYLTSSNDVMHYDTQIPYEDIKSWFLSHFPDSKRGTYKVHLLEAAIDQQRRGYTPRMDAQVTAFWTGYWRIACREFPELTMPEPGPKPAGSSWIELRPSSLGANRHLWHKLTEGFVDLQIDGAAREIENLKLKNQAILSHDVWLVPTTKSASFRIKVESIDHHGDAEAQIDRVRAGLRAALKLATLARLVQSV
jgi:hypothetical protein